MWTRKHEFDSRAGGFVAILGLIAMAAGGLLPWLTAETPQVTLIQRFLGVTLQLQDAVGGLDDGGNAVVASPGSGCWPRWSCSDDGVAAHLSRGSCCSRSAGVRRPRAATPWRNRWMSTPSMWAATTPMCTQCSGTFAGRRAHRRCTRGVSGRNRRARRGNRRDDSVDHPAIA